MPPARRFGGGRMGAMRSGGQSVTITLGGGAPAFTSKKRKEASQGGVEMMSASQKKAMGAGLGVKMKGRLGKRLGSNDLRLRLGGASAPPSKVKVTFEQHSAGSAAQASEDTERWGNDMYFKSGQAQMAAPLRQAVMERPPSFLTTATGRRREASAAVSAGSARVLASTGILKSKAGAQKMASDSAPASMVGIVRRGRGTFAYKG